MRAVAAARRPPPAAWGLAALAMLPQAYALAAWRYGWPGGGADLGGLWALLLLGLSSGMLIGAAVLRGHWAAAYAAIAVLVLCAAATAAHLITLTEATIAGFIVILGLDLWAARIGLMPDWWPRLKLGFTALSVALLLGYRFG